MYKKLKKLSLFKDISIEKIKKYFDTINYRKKDFSKDEIIGFRGDKYEELIILIDGKVEGKMPSLSGETKQVEIMTGPKVLAPNFIFGKNILPVDIIAKNDSEVVFIKKEDLLNLFQSDKKILENYLNILCKKSYFLTQRIFDNFTYKTIKEKLTNYFLKNLNEKNSEVKIKMTQRELAEYFGIRRPSLSREIKKLRDQDLIKKIGRNKYKILNKEKLLEILDEEL
ncbi:MAG: Crp/Fnr family transcriptional regulator [Fusobacteriota bacterium]